MSKKTGFAILAAAAIFAFSAPAIAESEAQKETFTSADGVLSMELADDTWQEIQDPVKWIALTNGSDVITAEHYSNGEKLPEMTIADSQYAYVFQTVLSTKNEVFIISGKVMNPAKLQEVTDIVTSAKVLQYDTKLAIQKESEADVSEFSLAAMDKTMYATADLNVRAGCSTDSQIIGGVAAGDTLKVTGMVQRGGQDYGWYQVSFNNGAGYVSAAFVSETAPAKKDDAASSGAKKTGNTIGVYWQNGNGETLYEYTDGNYYSEAGVRYTYKDGVYKGTDGTTLYPNPDELDKMYGGGTSNPASDEEAADQANEEHVLVRVEDGKEVYVSAGGGAYYDDEGTEYSWINDGQMMDYYGHIYNVRW